MTLKAIKNKIKKGDYRFSDHAVKQMIKRSISRQDVESAIYSGKIIEKYPDDKYSPSCLIYGKTNEGKDIHVQVSLPPAVVIITTYIPNPEEWIECKIRR
jgi:hypothetical protein